MLHKNKGLLHASATTTRNIEMIYAFHKSHAYLLPYLQQSKSNTQFQFLGRVHQVYFIV